ncbi:hypothetical protein [Streptomyces sp. TRM68367]|uniref:hypothetical protein n=1 Tax=Streptomyces sp. TRM68367 TaxID=2758415 RepID=UPI00165B2DF9|nr:hypothetical protein [Streptomyces sp. TRM68367]MBC9729954.1 hypothetical protein [Streptomyces sp. TRM68367]
MRTLLRARLDTERGSEAIRSGKMPELIKETLDKIKPEAAYFGPDEGRRTMFLVFDLADPSQIPSIAEPLFLNFGAELEWTPVMNLDDVQKGLSQIR